MGCAHALGIQGCRFHVLASRGIDHRPLHALDHGCQGKQSVLVHRFMFMDREWRALAQFPHATTRFLRLLGAALFLAVSPLSLVRRFFDP